MSTSEIKPKNVNTESLLENLNVLRDLLDTTKLENRDLKEKINTLKRHREYIFYFLYPYIKDDNNIYVHLCCDIEESMQFKPPCLDQVKQFYKKQEVKDELLCKSSEEIKLIKQIMEEENL